MISFIPINEDNYRECLNLKVTDDQLKYVGNSNALSLAKAYIYYGSAFPLAIFSDNKMISFILIRNMEELGNYLIEKIMIDKEYQGKGFGKAALKKIIEEMKKESKYRKLCICCNINNGIAMNLYHSFGFKQVEKEEEGEIVLGIEW